MLDVKEIKLIRTELDIAGKREDDPKRLIQYWTLSGELIIEFDPHTNKIKKGNSYI